MSKYGTGKVILGEWGCLFFISRTLNNVLLFLFFRASGFWMSKYGTGKVMGVFVFCSRTLTNVLLFLFFRASGFWMSKYGTGKVILGEWGCLFLFQER